MADIPESTKLPERANYMAIAPGSYLGAIVKGAPFIFDFDHDGEELVRVADVQPADDVCCKVRLEGETFWHPEFEFRRRATPLYTRAAPPAMDHSEVVSTLRQYINDLRYPPSADSAERRIAAAERAIAKVISASQECGQ